MKFEPSPIRISRLGNLIKASKTAIEASWSSLKEDGASNHSATGLIAAHLLNRCVEENVAFKLWFFPPKKLDHVRNIKGLENVTTGGGYYIKLFSAEEELAKFELESKKEDTDGK